MRRISLFTKASALSDIAHLYEKDTSGSSNNATSLAVSGHLILVQEVIGLPYLRNEVIIVIIINDRHYNNKPAIDDVPPSPNPMSNDDNNVIRMIIRILCVRCVIAYSRRPF